MDQAYNQTWRSNNISKIQNVTNTTSSSESRALTSEVVLEVFILAAIEMLILSGNALVMLAFFKGPRRMRTITNYFVVNLAISDLMVGCLSLPFWICFRLGIAVDSVHKYFAPLDILFGTASILSLVSISLERMYAVKMPAEHFNLSRKPVYVCIAFTWIIGIVVTAINMTLFEYDKLITTVLIFLLAFVIPLCIIIISYIVIFVTAHNLTRADNQNKSVKREIAIAKTISVIIGLFVFCWAPFFFINLIFVTCSTCFSNWELPISLTKALHYGNSMMNVFVYAVRSPDYRQTFKALLTKCDAEDVRNRLRTMSFQPLRRRSTDIYKSKLNNNEESSSSSDYKYRVNGSMRYDNSKLLNTET